MGDEERVASSAAGAGHRGVLTVLGCDGSYPGPGGAASGYLVEGGGATLWLDAGAGTFANLQLVCDPAAVDAVVLTHEHPDHWSDVDSFAVWLRQSGRAAVPVYAPAGVRARSYFADEPSLGWLEVDPSLQVTVRKPGGEGGLVCAFSATDHGPPTFAVRMDLASRLASAPRRSLAYSADTGPGWSCEALGTGVETLLCEATYTRDLEGSARHLSGRQAGEMAAAAGVGTLVVTHRRPGVSAAALRAEAFGRPVRQAVTGKVFEW